jgi:4'-phosphopantetheinyl transferase
VNVAAGELHLWPLPDPAARDGGQAERERERARAGLRQVLAGYLDVDPDDVRVVRAPCPRCGEPHGRPELDPALGGTARLRFSLAHSRRMAVVAVASDPVGVDVEALAVRVDEADLEATLHPAERRQHAALVARGDAATSRRTALLGCWVRKEAYLKGLGIGLGRDPDTVDVGLPPAVPATPRQRPGPDGWALVDLPAGPDHVAAAAVDGRLTTVHVFSQPNNVSVRGRGLRDRAAPGTVR